MKKSALLLSVAALVCSPFAVTAHDMSAPVVVAANTTAASPAKVAALKTALENLWIGHINAVRKVDVAAIDGDAAGEKAAEAEVVANAHAFGTAISGFYGQAAGDKLFTLLAGHYGAVKAYLEAAIAKNADGESKATDQLTTNANDLAVFFSSANPYLPKDTVSQLLLIHGSHHIEQIQELIAKNVSGEAATQAKMKAHVIAIGDAMAEALANQFPDKV